MEEHDEMRLAGLAASAIDLALRERGVLGLLALHLAVHTDGRFSSWPAPPKISSVQRSVALASLPTAPKIKELAALGSEAASIVQLIYADELAREAAEVLAHGI